MRIVSCFGRSGECRRELVTDGFLRVLILTMWATSSFVAPPPSLGPSQSSVRCGAAARPKEIVCTCHPLATPTTQEGLIDSIPAQTGRGACMKQRGFPGARRCEAALRLRSN
eukprot:scaffold1954_cov268-Pinguiococcus_pyrenoidosus.AAC.74